MFTQQRHLMAAAKLTFWLLVPPVLIKLIVSGVYIAIAVFHAYLFTELLGPRRYSQIFFFIAIITVLLLIRPLLNVCGQLIENRAGLIVKRNLRHALLKEIDRQGPMRVGLGRSGNIQSVISDGVEAIESYFVRYLTQLVVTAVTTAVLIIALAFISIWVALALLLCGIAVVAIPRLWDKVLAERGQEHWIAYETLNADFIDAMMGMSTLKSFGAADDYGEKLQRQSHQLMTSTMGQLRLSLGETGLSGMMKVLGPALALIIAIFQVRAGSMELSQLFFVTMLSVEMFRSFTLLSAFWHEAFFGISAVRSMNNIFTRISPDDNLPTHQVTDVDLDATRGISFTDVTYTYLGSKEPAIEHMSFHIDSGSTTAIVGLSGSGKSTALGLLIGYDQPESGSIDVFGLSPSTVDVTQLMTLVPQDPIIFPGTIRDILRSANPDASAAQMMKALRSARADQLHMELDTTSNPENVLDVHILEHAKNLSGGQRQRLAIARALIRGTRILVLDESTSALDTYTESEMLRDLRATYPELTLVLVTHRIDTAAKSDRVIVLSQRQVSCAGVPEKLAQDPQSTWSELVAAQLGEN